MLEHINLEKTMVLDIETVPMVKNYQELSENMQALWADKAQRLQPRDGNKTPEELFEKAGIFAEFGKVVCISSGIFISGEAPGREKAYQFRVKSFYGADERKILINFMELLNQHFDARKNFLCAHNGQEFDFPYLARRILLHGFELPQMLDIAGKKPWETKHLIDTMQLWKFGDYKHFTSLPLLTRIFNIPTPKDDIKGSDVGRVFYEEADIDRIAEYCQKDVIATGRLLMKFKGLPVLKADDIIEVNE